MDLSKLYLEKEYDTQEQAAAEGIITSWTDDRSCRLSSFCILHLKCRYQKTYSGYK